jgi:hypothetical protein
LGWAWRPTGSSISPSDYYEIDMDRAAVEHVVAHRPLADTVIQALNPQITAADLWKDIATIGYPITAM